MIPPGRPLAFILSGIMIVGSFGLSTGFFLTSEPSTDNWAGLSNQYKTENEKDPGHEAYRQKYLEKWKF